MTSEMPFTKTKAFQKENHDTASQSLKEYANKNWGRRWVNLFQKKLINSILFGSGRRPTWSCRHWRRAVAVSQHGLTAALHIVNIDLELN